jgi:hypothetical protein
VLAEVVSEPSESGDVESVLRTVASDDGSDA